MSRSAKNVSVLRQNLAREGWFFLLPALLTVGGITIFPILFSTYMSFNHISLTFAGFHFQFVGLKNYFILWHSSLFRYALTFTLLYTVVTVLVELILGMMTALVLQRLTSGRVWVLTLLLLPWSLVTVISAEMWSYIYNGVYGVLDAILMGLHLTHSPTNWLGQPNLALIATGVADIWKTTPFVAIILLAGLEMIPSSVYEAAALDGASEIRTFITITVPLLRPTIGLAVLFRILQAFGLFDLPYVLTSGGPGNATESLALLGYQVMFQDTNFGRGAAIAATTAIIVVIVSLLFLKAFKAQVGKEEIS